MIYFRPVLVPALCAFLSGCGGGLSQLTPSFGLSGSETSTIPSSSAPAAVDDKSRIQAVLDLRKRLHDATDIASQSELRNAESEAASHFLADGSALAGQERFEEAVEKYDLGLIAQPSNAELQQARQTATGRKETFRLYVEAQRAKSVGNTDLAETLLEKAASFDTQNSSLKRELLNIERTKRNEEQRVVLAAFQSPKPVAINFREAKLKDALKVLCDPYNLNFVYDKGTDNLDVSVSAKNVTFEQAFNMVLQSSNTAYKVLGPNSLFIYEDTPEKRKQYADRYFKTFHLSTLKAERMAEILKSSMDIKTLVANNDLGTIQVRDTRDVLDVVEKLVAANDRKPAEIMLNVEVLEINRSKAENLGIDYGGVASVQSPQINVKDLFGKNGYVEQSFVNMPTVTLNFLKSNTDARTLSNPRVRTVDGMPAKIHVGDRVPLQSASIQDATGQSRVLYEYHDVGIKLDVLPKYHLDDSIFVDMNIEVSALGSNIGSSSAPAYTIETRNLHTTMILREGETACLGGLIKEDESHSLTGVPGLVSSPIIGRLFANPSDAGDRTELILTITPRLIRSQSLPRRKATDFYSGTDNNYSTRSSYEYLDKTPNTDQLPAYRLNPDNRKAEPGGVQPTTFVR
jgi:general secretion pathway protein D